VTFYFYDYLAKKLGAAKTYFAVFFGNRLKFINVKFYRFVLYVSYLLINAKQQSIVFSLNVAK